jgi:Na+(H+)/acetate symporter ActP
MSSFYKGFIIMILVTLTFVIVAVVLTPSCKSLGGTTVADGMHLQYSNGLKMSIPVTKYKCVRPLETSNGT